MTNGEAGPTAADIARFLAEDIGPGDLTASIIPAEARAVAVVITREAMLLCGQAWFAGVFEQLDPSIKLRWQADEGALVAANQPLCLLEGPARALLTGERTALNLLQTLSATATLAHRYAEAVKGTRVRILDTRKTLPGLRDAQKYAVRCGGCHNHRVGLYDGILIKENHILSAGSITHALQAAQALGAGVMIEVEVETLDELAEALAAGARRVLLDEFSLSQMREAVALTQGRAELEVSGSVTLDNLREIAETGVDYISVGALTKNVRAIDLSMRVIIGA
ncbi:MAG: carboxylating nicotinate-nucleotide diphosphorylase [Methylococcaceae bacterium]|jgi:nicotinate-nucleotide pyrophosphorylase (carboxylating)